MNYSTVLSAIAVTVGLATSASAVTITSVIGVWESASVSGGTANGVNEDTISWGTAPRWSAQSAYSFSGEDTPFETEVDELFDLGTFTHSNNPIYTNGPMLNSANLSVSFTIEGSADTYSSVFTFDHWETPNDGAPCADGGTDGNGVNVNGCADRVTVSLNEAASESFIVDGMEYLLDISGFLYEGSLLDSFWTTEQADNSAILQASYRLISEENPEDPEDPQDPPSEVPLPASGLLLLGGLAGLVAARRRK